MDPREQRGLIIAAVCKLNRTAEGWLVPSQSTTERIYHVNVEQQTCTCPDHTESGFKCKHIFAVEFTIKRECRADGSMIETKLITFTEKKTCRQDWPKYNLAQMIEKKRFQSLLFDICRGVQEPPRQPGKRGRKPTPMADMVFASALKVYTTFSSRRFACDLADAHAKGYLSNLMHSVMVCAYLENETMTPVLKGLIVQSSLPLRMVETDFAPDSSGFSTSRFVRWYDEKYGVHRSGKEWVKAHVCTGVKTNVVTAVEILDKDAADCPQFGNLIGTTAQNFKIGEVSADKAYLSHANLELVESLGGTPFVPFKVNSSDGAGEGAWGRMWNYFQARRDEFLAHYHKRSNAESTFSMVKAKFRDHVRSKTDVAMKNEVLCKFLCHNICCVISAQIELGIAPVFWTGEEPETDGAVILPIHPQ